MESTTIQPWNKGRQIKINRLTYNQDHTLFILATSNGYRVFETRSLKLLSKVDDFQDIISDIAIACLFYCSSIIYFVGTEENITFSNNQLIVWDDSKNNKIATLILKDPIQNLFVTERIIYVFTGTNVMFIDANKFQYIGKYEGVNMDNKLYSLSYNDILVYNTLKEKNIVNILKFKFKDQKLYKNKQRKIECNFPSIQAIKLSNKGNKMFVANSFGNKLHIYNLEVYEFEICLFIGEKIMNLENICFYPKSDNYIMLICDERKIQIFSIKNDFKYNYMCHCDEHDDNILLGKNKPEEKKSLFKGLLNNFQKVKLLYYFFYIIENIPRRY